MRARIGRVRYEWLAVLLGGVANDNQTRSEGPEARDGAMKKIVLWAITIFFVLGALGFMPSLGSVLLLVCVVLIVPIDGLRNLFPDIME